MGIKSAKPQMQAERLGLRLIVYAVVQVNAIVMCVMKMAGAEGLEPTALGFGDRCSTN